uniref:S41 family peptidase n=1 Tax=candidate division WOR-3 bacterium TaxID=2052148 RepID=A0A7C3NDI4_UNCW3
MKKNIVLTLLMISMTLSVIGWFVVAYGQDNKNTTSMNIFFNPEMRKFVQVLQLLKESYYREVSDSQLLDEAINGMLKTLDPHSVYIYKESDLQNFYTQTTGTFGGIGFRVGVKDGFITVISPIENTPASRAGIKAGDIIVMIDTISTDGMDVDKAVSLMRGKPGTKVKLKINRFGTLIDFDITREIITIKSIPYYGMIDDSVGYIKLTQFTERVEDEFYQCVKDLFEKRGAKKLIVDLRQNPGGLLNSAISISDIFLPKGAQIVSTRSKNPSMDYVFRATQPIYKGFFPLVILVDDGSASASEIVAGALQDWDRALILGDTTYGKGSVQSVIDFSKNDKKDKGILKFTTARYFTPSGRSIDRELIKYENSQIDTNKYYTLGELNREVSGGGGIIPDFVYQERFLSKVEIDILTKQALMEFVSKYLSKNKVGENFVLNFDKKVFDEYLSFLVEKNVNVDDIKKDTTVLKNVEDQLLYEFAREIGGENLFYRVYLKKDFLVNKSLDFLKGSKDIKDMFFKLNKN